VFNLLSNAVKFTHEGGIALRARRDGDRLVIQIADSGIGIPEDKKAIIFESFRQVDSGITRRYGGTGLGLTLSLPLRDAAPAAEARPEARATRLAEARLLVVEANPLAQRILVNIVAGQAAAVETAAHAGEAAAILANGGIDHILAETTPDLCAALAGLAADLAAREVRLSLLLAADAPAPELPALTHVQLIRKPIAGAALADALAASYPSGAAASAGSRAA
jgi:hypothetical protein